MSFLRATIFCAAFAISSVAYAQPWSSAEFKVGESYPGTVVLKDGTTLEGFVKYRNQYKMQTEVIFFTERNVNKTKENYFPKEVQEYTVAGKTYHCIHYTGGLFKKELGFVWLQEEGCISRYKYFSKAEGYNMMRKGPGESQEDFEKRLYPDKTVYQKEGDEYPVESQSFALKFSKKMSEFISDNAELAGKVADKEKGYRLGAMYDIIKQYNEECAK